MVKILLGRDDVDLNKVDVHDRAPFWRAISNRYEGVMNMLLGRGDLNLDELGWDDKSPLWWDAENAYP